MDGHRKKNQNLGMKLLLLSSLPHYSKTVLQDAVIFSNPLPNSQRLNPTA